MASSRVDSQFTRRALRLGVQKPEFQLLQMMGISNADKFYYRMPSPALLEIWLDKVASRKTTGEDANGNPIIIDRFAPNDMDTLPQEWLLSDGAGDFRRLWEVNKALAKADIENLTGTHSSATPKKLGPLVLADARRRASERGLVFSSAKVIPSNATLS